MNAISTKSKSAPQARSKLTEQLASSIEALIASGNLKRGDSLVERVLAERLDVSRSPIRGALKLLHEKGVISIREDGGYVVSNSVSLSTLGIPQPAAFDQNEVAYLRIAEDRLNGLLPDKVSERNLCQRYELTKSQLAIILQRASNEGWLERSPGQGWRFLPTLTSSDVYDQGYRFRILMESAAIMEPGFKVNEDQLRVCLAQQQELIDGAVEWVSPAQLFDTNTHLHEVIASFSGNIFILESLKRINRLRRLMEYKKIVDRVASARRCREHKVLIELLLSGQREAAADFIRLHLRDSAREKSSNFKT